MTKYAAERIWRAPDGSLIPESEVKDGQNGGLGTVLAYAQGDAIEGDDESAAGKLATSKAPDVARATNAPPTPPTPPTDEPSTADDSASADGSSTEGSTSGVTTESAGGATKAVAPRRRTTS